MGPRRPHEGLPASGPRSCLRGQRLRPGVVSPARAAVPAPSPPLSSPSSRFRRPAGHGSSLGRAGGAPFPEPVAGAGADSTDRLWGADLGEFRPYRQLPARPARTARTGCPARVARTGGTARVPRTGCMARTGCTARTGRLGRPARTGRAARAGRCLDVLGGPSARRLPCFPCPRGVGRASRHGGAGAGEQLVGSRRAGGTAGGPVPLLFVLGVRAVTVPAVAAARRRFGPALLASAERGRALRGSGAVPERGVDARLLSSPAPGGAGRSVRVAG
ncbi:hypothetical protein J2S52_005691 [Streptomyces sp. DSM 41037]|nr:hypothetical protein [Streptomyces sp. DSM 41037]